MNKLYRYRHSKTLEKGFSTFEVLISIIIALIFVSVAMQSFVLAMAMKVQAQEKQRANQLIQEDLERVADLAANNITVDHANQCNPVDTVAPNPIKTAYENGYAQELWDEVQPSGFTAPSVQLLRAADGTQAGKTLTLARTHVSATTSSDPHRTLKINYQVTDSGGDVIAERYVEVIPDVALLCP